MGDSRASGSAQVRTSAAKEAFVAGLDNGIKPLNAAALQYVDQVCCLSHPAPCSANVRAEVRLI